MIPSGSPLKERGCSQRPDAEYSQVEEIPHPALSFTIWSSNNPFVLQIYKQRTQKSVLFSGWVRRVLNTVGPHLQSVRVTRTPRDPLKNWGLCISPSSHLLSDHWSPQSPLGHLYSSHSVLSVQIAHHCASCTCVSHPFMITPQNNSHLSRCCPNANCSAKHSWMTLPTVRHINTVLGQLLVLCHCMRTYLFLHLHLCFYSTRYWVSGTSGWALWGWSLCLSSLGP